MNEDKAYKEELKMNVFEFMNDENKSKTKTLDDLMNHLEAVYHYEGQDNDTNAKEVLSENKELIKGYVKEYNSSTKKDIENLLGKPYSKGIAF